jgi:hypothetical protein
MATATASTKPSHHSGSRTWRSRGGSTRGLPGAQLMPSDGDSLVRRGEGKPPPPARPDLVGVELAARALIEAVHELPRHCPGRKPPFSAIKRLARPCKSTIQN